MANPFKIGPLPPLSLPPLDRVPSNEWDFILRCQTAAAEAFDQMPLPELGDQPDIDPAPELKAEEVTAKREVTEGPAAGLRRKKRKPEPAPSESESVEFTRQERNKISAKKYRTQKKLYVTSLETENEKLKRKVAEQLRTIIAIQKKVVHLTGRVDVLTAELSQYKQKQPACPPF